MGLGRRASKVSTFDDHVGTVATRPVDLHEGSAFGHDDGDRHAEPPAVIGQRLGVVAGRGGDDTALALIGIQQQQTVQRAALLEATGEVQVVELDPDLGPGQLGQAPGVPRRGMIDLTPDALAGGLDIGKGDGHPGYGSQSVPAV